MSKRHDAIFEDVLKDMNREATPAEEDRSATRFLRRSNALADVGEREEKVLRWVDPEHCVMWAHHNRAYELLNEDNCRDLIDSIKSQGQQEFPAIVRRKHAPGGVEYEVVCGGAAAFCGVVASLPQLSAVSLFGRSSRHDRRGSFPLG